VKKSNAQIPFVRLVVDLPFNLLFDKSATNLQLIEQMEFDFKL